MQDTNYRAPSAVEQTVWAHTDDFTMFGSAAYRLVRDHREAIENARSAPANRAFVFDQDGTLRAAQATEDGARHYMTPERVLVLTGVLRDVGGN